MDVIKKFGKEYSTQLGYKQFDSASHPIKYYKGKYSLARDIFVSNTSALRQIADAAANPLLLGTLLVGAPLLYAKSQYRQIIKEKKTKEKQKQLLLENPINQRLIEPVSTRVPINKEEISNVLNELLYERDYYIPNRSKRIEIIELLYENIKDEFPLSTDTMNLDRKPGDDRSAHYLVSSYLSSMAASGTIDGNLDIVPLAEENLSSTQRRKRQTQPSQQAPLRIQSPIRIQPPIVQPPIVEIPTINIIPYEPIQILLQDVEKQKIVETDKNLVKANKMADDLRNRGITVSNDDVFIIRDQLNNNISKPRILEQFRTLPTITAPSVEELPPIIIQRERPEVIIQDVEEIIEPIITQPTIMAPKLSTFSNERMNELIKNVESHTNKKLTEPKRQELRNLVDIGELSISEIIDYAIVDNLPESFLSLIDRIEKDSRELENSEILGLWSRSKILNTTREKLYNIAMLQYANPNRDVPIPLVKLNLSEPRTVPAAATSRVLPAAIPITSQITQRTIPAAIPIAQQTFGSLTLTEKQKHFEQQKIHQQATAARIAAEQVAKPYSDEQRILDIETRDKENIKQINESIQALTKIPEAQRTQAQRAQLQILIDEKNATIEPIVNLRKPDKPQIIEKPIVEIQTLSDIDPPIVLPQSNISFPQDLSHLVNTPPTYFISGRANQELLKLEKQGRPFKKTEIGTNIWIYPHNIPLPSININPSQYKKDMDEFANDLFEYIDKFGRRTAFEFFKKGYGGLGQDKSITLGKNKELIYSMFKPPTQTTNFEKIYKRIYEYYNLPGNNEQKEQNIMTNGMYVPDIVRKHLRTASLKTPAEIYHYNEYGKFPKKPIRNPVKLTQEKQ